MELLPRPFSAGYDRPTRHPLQSRSAARSTNGMVATSHPLAALAGLDILKQGGNAIDAAVAANAMLGVVEPMSCGIGGDLFAIVWDAKTHALRGLNASGRSPRRATLEHFQKQNLAFIPETGPLSWSVPGCVAGWGALLREFGSKTLRELLSPAISTAEEGFPVTEVIASDWNSAAAKLAQWPDTEQTFLVNGRAPQEGARFANPRLAHTMQQIASAGPECFYQGDIAEQIVRFSEQHGGLFSREDFAAEHADWIEPVSTTFLDCEIWELPPNGQGIAVLQMLNLLEPFHLESLEPGSPEYLHLLIEAKKLAYADRARFYADPDFAEVPVRELISKSYAHERIRLLDRGKAMQKVLHGDPKLSRGDTIYLTAVDKDRNCCSLIQSNYFGFGSMVVPGELGFPLQNRGCLFSLDKEHPNCLAGGKRPFHTIIPGMVTRANRPLLSFGVMGGDMQPQGHVQVLINMLCFGMNAQHAGDAARVQHKGSATPTGIPADEDGGTVQIESGISAAAAKELARLGHHVERAIGGFGGYQAIKVDWENGTLEGGTDPRKDGLAIGY